MRVTDFKSIKLKIASPEEILSWSHGEVTKPETINYRTQRPEKDGLFCERIFGPTKDWECYCGKYRRIRYKGVVCDRCGVEVTRSIVRRERMGHIQLAVPVAHIWFLRSLPSKIGAILDVPMSQVEMVAYFSGYMITTVNEELKDAMRRDIEQEFKSKIKSAKEKTKAANKEKKGKVEKVEKEEDAAPTMESRLRSARTEAVRELDGLRLGRVLSEVEFRNLSLKYGAVFEAATGAEAIKRVMESLDLKALDAQIEKEVESAGILQKKKSLVRLKIVKNLSQNGIRPEWMLISQLPILPSDLRPMVQLEGGRFASSDLNDLYRRVINRNNRLKKLLELKAPEVICRNEKRMLQEAVDALIDNSARRGLGVMSSSQKRPLKSLADMLKGKQGRFRQNLLGKRVDYSARSVIVAGPELRLDECGIPKNMALELFKPFVIREIIKRELSHNVRAANRLIEDGVDEVWAILEEVIKDKLVLLNRAPTLHRLGVQAFKPILIEGLAIRIHPMVCRAFNADFDGDQMAVHLPLSDEAQKEAWDLMLSSRNLLKPANGQPIVRPTQDIVLGAYFLTHVIPGSLGEGKMFASKNEAVLAWENNIVAINASIKVYVPLEKRLVPEEKFLETSVGRIIFNQALPNDFTFVNEAMGSSKLTDLVDKLIEIYGAERVGIMLDILKKLGFEYATRSGITWSMNEIEVPKGKDAILDVARREVEKLEEYFERGLITEEERYKKVVETWSHAISKVHKLIPASLPEGSSVAPIINSKARGSWTQLNQMAGMKGLVSNPAGNIIEFPVLHSYKEGLNVLEYFISTHGARKGTADTALKTATAGYLTRRLVDVAQDVVVKEKDCGDTMGIELVRSDAEKHNQSFFNKIYGRFLIEDIVAKDGKKETVLAKAGEAIDKKVAEAIELHKIDRVLVRSVLRCKTDHGLCQKCYGYDLGNNRIIGPGQAVGIVAAQAIGEPGTQLTMRTFHTGGVAGVSDITMGLPRVQELFEVQPPKGRATISEVDGIVLEVREEGKYRIVTMLEEAGSSEEPKKPEKKRRTSKVALSSTNEQGRREYKILKEMKVLVHEGSKVKKGEQLSEGHVDVKELFKFAGREAVERYIVTEVQKIYTIEGDPIHDKHIEVIVRQMFARVRIKEGGDSHFAMGEIVEKDIFKQVNRELKRKGKTPARAVQLLMGITKVSHTTDSFLSSASFQETVKVLVNAAVSGKEDKLRGLKENVIIGRLIPAGTGYRGMDAEK